MCRIRLADQSTKRSIENRLQVCVFSCVSLHGLFAKTRSYRCYKWISWQLSDSSDDVGEETCCDKFVHRLYICIWESARIKILKLVSKAKYGINALRLPILLVCPIHVHFKISWPFRTVWTKRAVQHHTFLQRGFRRRTRVVLHGRWWRRWRKNTLFFVYL